MKTYILSIVDKGQTTSWIVGVGYDEPLFDFFCKLLKHTALQEHDFIREYGDLIPATCEGGGRKRKRIDWCDNKGHAISLSLVKKLR